MALTFEQLVANTSKSSNRLTHKSHHRFLLRNMLSECCLKLIRLVLEQHGVALTKAKLGDITVSYDEEQISIEKIRELIVDLGFEEINDRDAILVEEIKRVVVELVHHTTYNAMVRNSDFLVSRFDKSYQHLSTVFSKHEHITLEKYIILQRIEKVKELIQVDELSLSEIAFSMGYSSVQYLSTQFRSITGYTVTEYKALPDKQRLGAGLNNT